MNICKYTVYNEIEILDLYESVGWTNYTDNPQMLKSAFENSLLILAAYSQEKLVGIIRAVGDGSSVVLIQDILIYPDYQHQGIGTKLMKELLKRFDNVYQIQLVTDNTVKTKKFYQSLGFTELTELGCCSFQLI